jgi:hypothetical protein
MSVDKTVLYIFGGLLVIIGIAMFSLGLTASNSGFQFTSNIPFFKFEKPRIVQDSAKTQIKFDTVYINHTAKLKSKPLPKAQVAKIDSIVERWKHDTTYVDKYPVIPIKTTASVKNDTMNIELSIESDNIIKDLTTGDWAAKINIKTSEIFRTEINDYYHSITTIPECKSTFWRDFSYGNIFAVVVGLVIYILVR